MMQAILHTDEPVVENSTRSRIMVMGPASHAIAAALIRMHSNAEIHSVDNAAEAREVLETGSFDHLLIDNRADGAMSLAIPALSQLDSIKNITVLAGPQSSSPISALPGVNAVISAPYNPLEIANSLGIEVRDSRQQDNTGLTQGRRANDTIEEETNADVDEDKRPLIFRVLSALVNFIPGLTPLLSMLYKNLALTVLSALFIAFVSYGIMIAYFLTSGDWSSPLQLQRGHELVIKAERNRGSLIVKRNLVTQQLADAENKADRGKTALSRAETLAQIAAVTIDQETTNRHDRLVLIKHEIGALQGVIHSYGPARDRIRDKANLRRDFNRRVMTRHIYQQSLLNLAEIEKGIVSIREQISRKKTERIELTQGISYLALLKSQLAAGDQSTAFIGGKAEFIPIANQIIEVQQVRASSHADVDEFKAAKATLEDSHKVLSQSIEELENTPMIRALNEPVNVLFVPYDNLDAYTKDEGLYSCAFAIFWCSQVGTVGAPIAGEVATTHPFFGKPIRGQFVEANLTEKSAAQKEIIHVGRPPFFF